MTLLLTFVGALLVVAVCLAVFFWLGAPVYRVEAINVKSLLTLLLEDHATENDWDVFSEVPIRHNLALDEIRLRCCVIVANEAVFKHGRLWLTDKGKEEIKELLQAVSDSENTSQGKK